MANRVKEEERIEKIIRRLLKLPENKRCINCNSLGPQYVCTTFWTFVCTTCSGIHREFTHRVKSVSMAKFTAEEVSALQAGGNERARQIYLKAWDPQRHSFPVGSNLPKLREYIKHVYVDRKYVGERNNDPLPLVKLNKQNENYDRKSGADSKRRDSYERPGTSGCGRSDLKYYHDESRSSPRYARDNSRSGGFKQSPIRFEVVDDRFRDEGNSGGRKSDPRRTSSVEVMARSLSPVRQKNASRSMSPVVRLLDNLLEKNSPQLQVSDTTYRNKEKRADVPPNNHKGPPAVVGSSCVNEQIPVDKKEKSASLIDFVMDPQPTTSQTITEKETKQEAPLASVNPSANNPHGQSITTLESLLFELNVPSDGAPANAQQSGNKDITSTVPSRDTSSPDGDSSLAQGVPEPVAKDATSDAHQLNNVPPTLQSAYDLLENVTLGQQCKTPYDPATSLSLDCEPNPQQSDTKINQGQSSSPLEQFIQAISLGGNGVSSKVLPDTQEEARAAGGNEPPSRKELPADLFSLSYPQVAGWPTGQPHAMGFGMHCRPTAYQTVGFPNSGMSTNPFDLSGTDGSQPHQTEMFPSMASAQGISLSASAGILNIVSGNQLGPHPLYTPVPGLQNGHHIQPPADSPIGSLGFGAAGDFDFGSISSTQPASNKSTAPITHKSLPSTGRNPFE